MKGHPREVKEPHFPGIKRKSLRDAVGRPNEAFQYLLHLTGAKPWWTEAKVLEEPPFHAAARLAYEQKLLPLIADSLVERLTDIGMVELSQQVREAQGESTRRNLLLAAETLRLVRALEEKGIPTIPFKGSVLSWQAYGNLNHREAGDIDLLVARTDVIRAAEVLAKQGYESWETRTPSQQIGHLAFDCEWELVNRQRRIGVDLHWEFTGRNCGLPMPMPRIWERVVEGRFLGHRLRSLARTDLALFLCIHAAKHHWIRLEWACTLARILNPIEPREWGKLIAETKHAAVERIARIGVMLADEIYGVALPDEVRAWVTGDRRATLLAMQAMRWMWNSGPKPGISDLRRFNAATRSGLWGKAYYWVCAMSTPTARDYLVELPAKLHWTYYLFRVGRLLFNQFRGVEVERTLHVIEWVPAPRLLSEAHGLEAVPSPAGNSADPVR